LIDRLVAEQVGVDSVLGRRLAGVPLRPDRQESNLRIHLLIVADGGGSNGPRLRLWKREL
jgi:hypothetical protein